MPFTLRWALKAEETFRSIQAAALASTQNRTKNKNTKPSKSEGLFKQIDKCVRLLISNPRHPGLNTHEYDSIENPFDKTKKVFEAYVQNNTPGAYRLFWCYGPANGEITILAITPHP